MKRILLPLLAVLALPTAVNAVVNDEIHSKCIEANDYFGCVKAQISTKDYSLSKRFLKERCSWDNISLQVATKKEKKLFLENCSSVLNDIGDSALKIDLSTHKYCSPAIGYWNTAKYVECVSRKTNWILENKNLQLAINKCTQINSPPIGSPCKRLDNVTWKGEGSSYGKTFINDGGKIKQLCKKEGTSYYELKEGNKLFGFSFGKQKIQGYCLTDGEAAQLKIGIMNYQQKERHRLLDNLQKLSRPPITCISSYGITTCN